jgi:predicted butyrate kinase (DUF1464 family)
VVRVVGTDPGTSGLDLLLLVDGVVADQVRLPTEVLSRGPDPLLAVLRRWKPVDLVAGPSGYGLPLVRAEAVTERDIDAMSLVRADERGTGVGVLGFRAWVRALISLGLPVVFLPGGIHLPTIPPYRKANGIDLGTADKVAVVALGLHNHVEQTQRSISEATFAVVEIGSAFSAVLVVERGKIVDAAAGTRGPLGLRSSGAWDGEAAYWLSPLSKADLFRGGLIDLGAEGPAALRESLIKHVAGLKAITPFDQLYVSGSALEQSELATQAFQALSRFGTVSALSCLPGAWVKHAAQGSALLADGLAGGGHVRLVESLALREASGTVWDHLRIRRD